MSQFSVAYSSYIPVDHVTGPSPCVVQNGPAFSLLYMGDANRGTARTAESIIVMPDTQHYSNFLVSAGITRNYGNLSPKNGSTLSAADEDGIPNDCTLWNAQAQANPGGAFDVTYPFSHQAQVHFDGAVTNPLESVSAPIAWDMRTVLNTTSLLSPTAIVNYNHTCYPSHQIKVNGRVVYLYTPSRNDPTYIFGCLFLQTGKIIGQQSTATQVPLF